MTLQIYCNWHCDIHVLQLHVKAPLPTIYVLVYTYMDGSAGNCRVYCAAFARPIISPCTVVYTTPIKQLQGKLIVVAARSIQVRCATVPQQTHTKNVTLYRVTRTVGTLQCLLV